MLKGALQVLLLMLAGIEDFLAVGCVSDTDAGEVVRSQIDVSELNVVYEVDNVSRTVDKADRVDRAGMFVVAADRGYISIGCIAVDLAMAETVALDLLGSVGSLKMMRSMAVDVLVAVFRLMLVPADVDGNDVRMPP
ncbi:hypothetical protein BCR41DRAFT_372450 [Lobosporangium transversale]|uniref:Secreted protein n=1 Tax=Lobosporangium transversale TaxID=64571 RepID=A0A1Y2GGI5_9FUNG|nr:hypothetical protein BCR41DRAFT_372450 [Lobosporangium transversale]ORZ10263.1 hypothetical protein BCR41DRAFT_372450 [Lobosporangium transversale]|eukprot:XP_021879170.1 hypothetical protein BCR41DRAFT_372450 [Lobosporangium transversale]